MNECIHGLMDDKCECKQVGIRAGATVNVRKSLSVNASRDSLVDH